ncbi:AsmA family protein [Acidocella sp.]|uniref:AsmA family protein n=1 Tax=Acidocella sp. TaxID=50710 RepID=UPI003D06BDF8
MDRQRAPVSHRHPTPPRRGRWRRHVAVGALLVVILLPLGAAGLFIARFNPNAYAPQIIAAVRQATGRTLTIGGPLRLQFSLTPTLAASNLSLANPAGFTDPSLLTLDKVEARIALLPLLRHKLDILSLRLDGPKLYLERDKSGQADWNFKAGAPPATGAQAPQPSAAKSAPGYKIALESVELTNGQAIIRPQGGGASSIIQLTRLTGKAESLTAPLHLSGEAAIGSAALTLNGEVGPVERLTGTGATPWPVDLSFGFAGATAKLQGSIARPQNARGYDLTLSAAIPALETVGAALPPSWLSGHKLPPLRGLTATARITDQNTPLPALTNIAVTAGASDLSSLHPGLSLAGLSLKLPALSKSGTLSANGTLDQLPFVVQANFTAPSAFIPAALLPATTPPAGNFSESVNASLGDASLSLTGGIATPRKLSGAAMALTLNIPDLAALSAPAGQALPAWKNIAVKTTLIDPGGQGLRHAIGLDSLSATLDDARFGGDASLNFGPTPRLELDLNIAQANLDKLLAALPAPAATQPAAQPAGAPAAPTTATAGAIPDLTLPLALLRHASADIVLSADTLTYNKATYTAVRGHAVLNQGVLTLNPFTGQLPGGAVSASGSIDATTDPAQETLKLDAPALALAPFLHALNLPDMAQGTVQARLNATASGDNLPAMAASVSGQLGIASVNGVVDGAVIRQLFGNVLQTVGLPANLAGASGPVAVRCAALRLDALNGIGTVKALTVDSSRLFLQGGGTLNFGNETLGLVLKPRMKIGDTNMAVPVRVGGTFLAPTYGVAPQAAVTAAAQAAAGLAGDPLQQALGGNSLLGQAVGAITGGQSGDACPAALKLARMGQPGPAPAASSTSGSGGSGTGSQPQTGPRSLLNSLLGQ